MVLNYNNDWLLIILLIIINLFIEGSLISVVEIQGHSSRFDILSPSADQDGLCLKVK